MTILKPLFRYSRGWEGVIKWDKSEDLPSIFKTFAFGRKGIDAYEMYTLTNLYRKALELNEFKKLKIILL